MFFKDQGQIESLVWQNPLYMYRAGLLVRLSVRRKFERVGDIVDRTVKYGADSLTMAVERRYCEDLSGFVQRMHAMYNFEQSDEIFREAIQLYGLGLPKAGFLTQLLTGEIGCLDTHNLKMYDIDPKQFRIDGNWKSVEKAIMSYKAACLHCGGSEVLWNEWCRNLATIRPQVWPDAESVSNYHVQIVRGETV